MTRTHEKQITMITLTNTLPPEMLDRLKQRELEVLKVVREICKKYNLEYYLVGGTLLGAVRHQGFIPWDDDIDIAMFRKDYDRFQQIAQQELGDKYFLQTNQTDQWHGPFMKIRINGTLFQDIDTLENAKYHKGVFIDIFPLDNVLNPDGIEFKIRHRIIRILSRLLYRKCSSGLMVKSRIKYWIGLVLPYLFSKSFMIRWRHRLMIKDILENTEYVTSFGSGFTALKQLFRRDVYHPATELEFENETFCVPGQYDFVLRQLYGDYMKLPPENERVPKHSVQKYDF